MTEMQKNALRILADDISERGPFSIRYHDFTHGGAIGADTDAHGILSQIEGFEVFVRPCSDERYWYWIDFGVINIFQPKSPLERNEDIVNDGEILIACPSRLGEELRSGTWATVRYARKVGKPVIVLDPGPSE